MLYKKYVPFLLVLAILLAACSQAQETPEEMQKVEAVEAAMVNTDMPEATANPTMDNKPKETMDIIPTAEGMEGKSADMMETATPDAMMDDKSKEMETGGIANKDESMTAPAWFGMTLVDVTSGESFTIQDFKGKVILVETLAQWCSNCLKQQKQVLELHQLLGETPDFISLGLDIDANEDSASLKAYIEENGFTWRYAVSPVEVSREIGNLYGNQFLNPPSTPILIIDRQGEVHPLPFGIKSAEDLLKWIRPFLNEGM